MPRALCALAMTHYKKCGASPDGRTGSSAPTKCLPIGFRRGRCPPRPASVTRGAEERAGKSAKRRQWRMQRGDFEEVPRLADTTVAGNRLARRWAREPRPYERVARGAMGGRPQGSPLRCGTDRTSQGLPHPFSPHFLFSVCGFPVDKLPLPISPPFLWKFIISPVDKKSMHFAALRGFSTKVFSTTIITKKYLVYVLWAENMPGNFGIRKESVPC